MVIIYLTHRKQLISLWDILKELLSPVAAIVSAEMAAFTHLEEFLDRHPGDKQVTEEISGWVKARANAAAKIVSDLNLKMTSQKTRALSHCIGLNITEVEQLRNRLREVRETMIQELSSVNFLRATDDMETYLDKSIPFGTAVSEAFPNTIEDIAEAHQCFALGRYTAAMFHLGRAMESAVKRLAEKMHIRIKRDDWQSYLTAMNDHIAKMPFKTPREKAKRAPFAQAAAYFLHFKEAWRNETMHPQENIYEAGSH
jgi:hypothetical protein